MRIEAADKAVRTVGSLLSMSVMVGLNLTGADSENKKYHELVLMDYIVIYHFQLMHARQYG